jgi:hypothetical protein
MENDCLTDSKYGCGPLCGCWVGGRPRDVNHGGMAGPLTNYSKTVGPVCLQFDVLQHATIGYLKAVWPDFWGLHF